MYSAECCRTSDNIIHVQLQEFPTVFSDLKKKTKLDFDVGFLPVLSFIDRCKGIIVVKMNVLDRKYMLHQKKCWMPTMNP